VCAGFAVLPPIQKDMTSMQISVVIGLAISSWTIIKLLGKLRKSLAKVLQREQKDDEMEVETTPKGYNLRVSLHKRFWAWLQGEANTNDEMEVETTPKGYNLRVSLHKRFWAWLQGEANTDDEMEVETTPLIAFNKPKIWVVWVWNPITHSHLLVFEFFPSRMLKIPNHVMTITTKKM
jgi:hypothetical protein